MKNITKPTPTPGPWNYDRFETPSGDFAVYAIGQERCIAEQVANEANARLIAAAPELLEAAKEIEDAIHQSWPSCTNPKHKGGTCEICQSRRKLRAAIAKATGQEGR